jgi:hypothetical protein
VKHKRRPDLLTRIVDGEVIILDRANGLVHQLNATASHVWNAFDEKLSAADIAAEMSRRFSDTPETVLKDVHRTIAEFERLELLVDEHHATATTHQTGEDHEGC